MGFYKYFKLYIKSSIKINFTMADVKFPNIANNNNNSFIDAKGGGKPLDEYGE
jgi:hypothetical protein